MGETQVKEAPWLRAAGHILCRVYGHATHAQGFAGWLAVLVRWLITLAVPGVGFGIQAFIPGVRDLYPWVFPLTVLPLGVLTLVFIEAVRQRQYVASFESPSRREQVRVALVGLLDMFGFFQRQTLGPMTDEERNRWASAITKQDAWVSEFLREQPIDRDLPRLYKSDVRPQVLVSDARKAGCDLSGAPLWILTENRLRRLQEIYDRLVG